MMFASDVMQQGQPFLPADIYIFVTCCSTICDRNALSWLETLWIHGSSSLQAFFFAFLSIFLSPTYLGAIHHTGG